MHYFQGLLLMVGILHFSHGVCRIPLRLLSRQGQVLLMFVPTRKRFMAVASHAGISPTTEKTVHTCQAPTPSRGIQPTTPRIENETADLTDEFSIYRCNCIDFHGESFTHDYFEYEQGQKSIIVKDRLKQNVKFWQAIGTNEFILDVITNDVILTI
ncbi:uncharacterized protein LOC132736189 [Ruditapes philippinarum]|uniref:uncharacterized protein LOC132736189 n=1 Tax=Ruditapes philippinarum TaxID=129788 RepID=UPI00295A635A|nr:uncharacterized protein LOC132736189 [Ruditapes philippinarum]